MSVPLYRHEVSLDYARLELGLQYTIAPGWDVVGRVPWEIKDQRAEVAVIDVATPEQRAAMQRNIDLHHRSVTLRGVGDLMLLGRRRWSAAWRDGDALSVSIGATVPTGRTVENPYRLGDRGVQHLHIQFGTGTVDPLLEASYHAPIGGRLSTGAYLAGRFPFYENKRTFRAPPDATLGVHIAHRTTDRLQLRLEGALYAQGYGYWEGLRDENTGLTATSLTAGATYQLPAFSVTADVRYPISQNTLTEGDAFKQGPTFVLSVGGLLRRPQITPRPRCHASDQGEGCWQAPLKRPEPGPKKRLRRLVLRRGLQAILLDRFPLASAQPEISFPARAEEFMTR